MRHRVRPPGAIASRWRAPRRARRSRLAIEIAIALAVKFALIFAIWNAWFSDPVSRKMTQATIATDLFGPAGPSSKPGGNPDGSRP
jgi:hypothetical protein